MSIIRTKFHEPTFTVYKSDSEINDIEWSVSTPNRDEEQSWLVRYEYEASLINNIIDKPTKILEIGSGPGKLGQMLLSKNKNITDYHFVDRPGAKDVFELKQYKGKFFSQNLNNGLDTKELDKDYNFIMANDFLEHIQNPSNVVIKCREISTNDVTFFISVPNWRMGHAFVYRGLFDYDNFIYFMYCHGWQVESVYPSCLQCNFQPKLSSEETMPDELITSWNFYFTLTKIN